MQTNINRPSLTTNETLHAFLFVSDKPLFETNDTIVNTVIGAHETLEVSLIFVSPLFTSYAAFKGRNNIIKRFQASLTKRLMQVEFGQS